MRIVLIVIAFLFSAGVALADPVGQYSVSGTSPDDGSKYQGDVSVAKTGDTYKVVWTIDDQKYIGTGIGAKDFIAVSYKSGGNTGLALYAQQADGSWLGFWTYAGGEKIGTEQWAPKK